jgi:pyrroloquinoline quinone biosynthesis protein E
VELGRVLRVGERYLRYRGGRPSPVFCNYFITARCNLRCSYCPVRNPTGSPIFPFCRRTREVGTGEAKRMVAEAAELGVLWMSFSGGEPLLREDLEEVAGEGRERGMVTILDTNATLVTERRARNLARVFEVAVVSLQGMEEVNDAMRGPGG